MKVCIVGSGGYIGSSLKNYFISKDLEVIRVTSQENTFKDNREEYFNYADLADLTTCITILSDVDVLFYLCSPNQKEIEMEPNRGLSIVLEPLINILNAKKRLKSLKIIYFSTAQVYNNIPSEETITDNSIINPNNYYGIFHVFGEQLIKYSRTSLKHTNLTSIRLTNSFGFFCDHSCEWRLPALNEFISDAFDTNRILSKSDGSPCRDFVEISNVLNTCVAVARSDDLPENIICGSGITVNLSYTFSVIRNIMRKRYSKNIQIQAHGDLVQPEVSQIPRFVVSEKFNNIHSLKDFDKGIENAILAYERFRTCL
ncbi:NAD(P)-dependent oxidoreductase [Rhodobacteraceae bacterium]|nr:NAD(P)-dependent oxidoreductase [Paracoccaceae bacterium]